jgi:DnaK suppressor protein
MDDRRARELVAAERRRIEASLHALTGEIGAEAEAQEQQAGEHDAGTELATEMIEDALVADLRSDLAAVGRAEARIAAGTYGRSIESGAIIPDERLEANPLAERTVEEQSRIDADR